MIPSRFDKAGYFRYLNWVWERIAGSASVIDRARCRGSAPRKANSSFLCIIETPDDVAYGLIANDVRGPGQSPAPASAIPTGTTALSTPRLSAIGRTGIRSRENWLCARGALHLPTSRRLCEMCKTYRKYAQKTGKFAR